MIKLRRILVAENITRGMVELVASTKAEVTGTLSVIGLPTDYVISFGSQVITCDFHIGLLDSDGTWKWDDDVPEGTKSVSLNLQKRENDDVDVIEPVEELPEEEPEEKQEEKPAEKETPKEENDEEMR
jgi:hypothetical protein